MEWQDQSNTIWTNGPRLENGAVGAAVAFRKEGRWVKRGAYLGKNKEVFDAEIFAIMRAVRLLEERGECGMAYTIFSDSQAAISRVQHDGCVRLRPWQEQQSDGRCPMRQGQHYDYYDGPLRMQESAETSR